MGHPHQKQNTILIGCSEQIMNLPKIDENRMFRGTSLSVKPVEV